MRVDGYGGTCLVRCSHPFCRKGLRKRYGSLDWWVPQRIRIQRSLHTVKQVRLLTCRYRDRPQAVGVGQWEEKSNSPTFSSPTPRGKRKGKPTFYNLTLVQLSKMLTIRSPPTNQLLLRTCSYYYSTTASAAAVEAERTIREGPRNDWTRPQIKSIYDSPVLDLLFHGVCFTLSPLLSI